jgi:hypothetical protein
MAGAPSSIYNSFSGLTQPQFDYLAATHPSTFVADASRVENYSNPAINTADRNWQETLRSDPGYSWTSSDQASWKTNCNFGPHNAGPALDSILFSKK